MTGHLGFTTNDAAVPRMNFRLLGKVTEAAQPEVAVTGLAGSKISKGDNKPATLDGTNFGSVLQGALPVTRTFTVTNEGADPLLLDSLVLPAGLTLIDGLSRRLAPGESDAFTIRMYTDIVGTKSGQLTFTTNDADEPTFNFRILGKVL